VARTEWHVPGRTYQVAHVAGGAHRVARTLHHYQHNMNANIVPGGVYRVSRAGWRALGGAFYYIRSNIFLTILFNINIKMNIVPGSARLPRTGWRVLPGGACRVVRTLTELHMKVNNVFRLTST